MIKKFKLSPCCLALISIGVLAISSELYAREFFNPAFLTDLNGSDVSPDLSALEGANKQVISSQADSLIKISRIWADFFPANTSNQPI